MNIALCTDNNYVVPCMVTITSLFENNRGEDCHVYVLTEGLSSANEERFLRLAQAYEQRITVRTIGSERVASLYGYGRFNRSIYFRFLLPEILPEEERVLYLDCDIMIRRSLTEFYQTDLTDVACAVVEDQRCDDITMHNRIGTFSPYFNSGVLLMNLTYWRCHRVADELIRYVHDYPERCWFPDQDALNAVLANRVKWMDYRYNLQGEMLGPRCYLRLSAQKWEALDAAIADPAVIHFTDIDKPWYKECRHPYATEYLNYASGQSLIRFRLIRRDSLWVRLGWFLYKVSVKYLKKLGRDV